MCTEYQTFPHPQPQHTAKGLLFFFFFFFIYSSQTPVATGRIVGLSGGGARYTRPTCGLGVLMCLVHQEERREREIKEQSGMDESKKRVAGVRC